MLVQQALTCTFLDTLIYHVTFFYHFVHSNPVYLILFHFILFHLKRLVPCTLLSALNVRIVLTIFTGIFIVALSSPTWNFIKIFALHFVSYSEHLSSMCQVGVMYSNMCKTICVSRWGMAIIIIKICGLMGEMGI